MNILVTVGTYRFDRLIKVVDSISATSVHRFTCQIGQGGYTPNNCSWFEFSNDFDNAIEETDIIITHAGAGTVYSLLEKNKNIIVVPNTFRVDSHQLELTKYVKDNLLSLTCDDLRFLENLLSRAPDFFLHNKKKYTKKPFFKYSEIVKFITEQV